MKLSQLLAANGVVSLGYGIAFVLAPRITLGIYGMTQGPTEILVGQLFGVALIGIGFVTWFARLFTDPSTLRPINLAFLISTAIGVIVAVQGTLSGVMNEVGWSAVAIYLLLALGYAYFQFTAHPSS